MQFRIIGGNPDAKIWVDNQVEKDEILYFDIHMTLASEQIPKEFKIVFYTPCVDTYSVWSPSIRYERSLKIDWGKQRTSSRLAHWMPLHALVSAKGENRAAVAISDAKTPICLRSGVREEDSTIEWELVFFTTSVMPMKQYKATVRIDMRNIAYCDAICDIVSWWENECGYTPAYVPEHARLPMNSLWYSFHQQLDA